MNTTTVSTIATSAVAPAAAGCEPAAVTTAPVSVGPQDAGAAAATDLITALADAGMSPDRIEAVPDDVLSRRHDHPTAVSEEFYDAFASTAATLVAGGCHLEAG